MSVRHVDTVALYRARVIAEWRDMLAVATGRKLWAEWDSIVKERAAQTGESLHEAEVALSVQYPERWRQLHSGNTCDTQHEAWLAYEKWETAQDDMRKSLAIVQAAQTALDDAEAENHARSILGRSAPPDDTLSPRIRDVNCRAVTPNAPPALLVNPA